MSLLVLRGFISAICLVAFLEVIEAATVVKRPASQLVKLHPIDEAQYKNILRLTQSAPVISQARLISSRSNADDSRTLSTDENTNSNFLQLLRLVGMTIRGTTDANANNNDHPGNNRDPNNGPHERVSGTPLCVIRVADNHQADGDYPPPTPEERQSGRADTSSHNKNNNDAPVNCVVMVKGRPEENVDEDGNRFALQRAGASYYDPTQYGNYPYYLYNPYGQAYRALPEDPTRSTTNSKKRVTTSRRKPVTRKQAQSVKAEEESIDPSFLRVLQAFHDQQSLGGYVPQPYPYLGLNPYTPRYAYPFYPPPALASAEKESSKDVDSDEARYGPPYIYDPYGQYAPQARSRLSEIEAETDEDSVEDYDN